MKSIWDDAEVISTYTRRQAIEDGVLVNLRQVNLESVVRQGGFLWPIACTSTVFHECIEVTPGASRAGNDIEGRLWDVLWILKQAIARRHDKPRTEILFDVLVVRDRIRPTLTKLKAVAGPDDHGAPCLTIMFPDED
jgi:hypothetical protein